MGFDLNKIDKKLLLGGAVAGIILLILIVFFVSSFLTPAVDSNELGNNNSSSGFLDSGKKFTSDFRTQVEELNKQEEIKLTSFDLIEKEFNEGKITKDEYFIQSAFAAFEPEKIDSKYAGEQLTVAPDGFLWTLTNEFENLSPESQKELEKFILTPSNPKSFWYSSELKVNAMKEKNDVISFTGIMQNKHPVTGLEYQIEFPAGMDAKKTITENAFNKAFSKYSFEIALTEPKDWVHVFIMDLPQYDGLAYKATDDGAERCILIIKKGLDERMMKTTVAHELFHCFQFYVPLKYTGDEVWLMEATAVWAEEFVYATENTEHTYDAEFFEKLNKRMFDSEGLREYGSYLWFFYLYQNEGKTPDFMRDLLLHASMEGTKTAIKELDAFNSKFHEYALWNFNQKPEFKFYQDKDDKPTQTPNGDSVNEFEYIFNEKKDSKNISIEKGGMKYFDYGIIDSIKRIEFDFTELNPIPNAETGIQMIYEINGQKFYLDVSDRDKIEFCRTRENEKIDAVVFIVSNSDLDSKLEGKMKIDSTGECAPTWAGYVKINWNYPSSYDWSWMTGDPTTETRTRTGNYFSRETLIFDKEENEFLLKSRDASLRESDISLITYGHECGNQTKYDADFVKGSYSVNNATISKPMYILQDELNTRIQFNESTGKYELYDGITMGEKVNYSSIISYTRKPCPLEGFFTPAPYYAPQRTNSYGNGREPQPNDFPELTLSSDRKHLSGEGTANFQTGDEIIPVQVIIDYRYQ
ncbi:MAG: hypothetical protein JW703_02145 [Candidatus Diapherotrites archaeon]|nr:hypothetical protein [Candidatus Diapherotrites archaeon]